WEVYTTMLVAGIVLLVGMLLLGTVVDRLDRLEKGSARDTASLIGALTDLVRGAKEEASPLEAPSRDPALNVLSTRLATLTDSGGHGQALAVKTNRDLASLVEEMRGLFIAASRIGLDVSTEKDLLSSVVGASDREDMSQYLDLLGMEIPALRGALRARIAGSLQILLTDIERVKLAGGEPYAAEALAEEAVSLLEEGDYRNAAWRLVSAEESFEAPALVPAFEPPLATVERPSPNAFAWLAGPALVAVVFMAISAILLPAVDIYLISSFQLNTTVILALSYSWAGLGAFTLASALLLWKSWTRHRPL
ncbi:MAG: hypothetical protein R3291_04035, partial [Thermoplasmata archaeon]|nr:hypothetical protein [Thermoplasmata archaeon]